MKKTTRPTVVRDAVHTLIRRKPKQARGQLRVDEILDAAERLTRSMGWDKISTNHIAKEAGIPIGSLYQFFANKHAIAHALVERYMASIEEAFTSLPSNIESMSPAELVHAIFDNLLLVTQKHHGLHAMLIIRSKESEIGQIAAPIDHLLRSHIERMLAVRAPWMSAHERKVHALVSQVSSRAVFAESIHLNNQGNQAIAGQLLEQARVMQIAYYDRLLQDHTAGNS
jgi:AcrR family transcriptional regulator